MTRYKQDQQQFGCDWFSRWFRKELADKKILQEDFAEDLGIGWTTVRYYCTGARSPSLKTFLMIVDKLGYEVQLTEKR